MKLQTGNGGDGDGGGGGGGTTPSFHLPLSREKSIKHMAKKKEKKVFFLLQKK